VFAGLTEREKGEESERGEGGRRCNAHTRHGLTPPLVSAMCAVLVLMWLLYARRALAAAGAPRSDIWEGAYAIGREGGAEESAGAQACTAEGMFQWAEARGVVFGGVDVHNFNTGRGLRVLRDLPRGATVLSVPWETLITVEHLVNWSHPVGALVTEYGRKIPQMDYLALFLLYESANPRSEWKPWLCMLPSSFTSSIFWTEAELARRGSKELQQQTRRLQDALRTKFHTLLLPLVTRHPTPPPHAGELTPGRAVAGDGAVGGARGNGVVGAGGRGAGIFAEGALVFERYLWAIAAVRSRNFGVPWHGRKLKLLAPVIDMVNHQQHSRTAMYLDNSPRTAASASAYTSSAPSTSAPAFALVTGQNYTEGDEIYIEYSRSCNERLLLVYGFDLGPLNEKKDCHSVLQSMIDELDEEERR
jgi:hypothetical protein